VIARTMINGVRVRCSTVELSPTRWKAKFGRIDVSEASRAKKVVQPLPTP
jgi:hypothetical protein